MHNPRTNEANANRQGNRLFFQKVMAGHSRDIRLTPESGHFITRFGRFVWCQGGTKTLGFEMKEAAN
jgi:hypothetical protein